jgi:hypothetical protein
MKIDSIEKARYYVGKAEMILKERGLLDEEVQHYENKKAVRKAGRMLWYGVLLALDAVFDVREDRRTKVKIDDYLDAISERDEALAKVVDCGCDIIWVYIAYDGIQSKPLCDEGIRMANEIIDRCANMLE